MTRYATLEANRKPCARLQQDPKRAQGGEPAHASELSDKALEEFAKAVHDVTDGTSPAHVDQNGNPRDWNGIPVTQDEIIDAAIHNAQEEMPNTQEMKAAVKATQDASRKTFGEAATREANVQKKEKKEE